MRRIILAGLALAVTSCRRDQLQAPPPPTFAVIIRVDSDPGAPLPGATVTRKDHVIGVTGPDGKVSATFQGIEGDVLEVKVACPAGFETPKAPVPVPLRRLSENRAAEYTAKCPPTFRKVVVVIRADNGPYVPVMHLNEVVARTDASGAATFLANVKPNEELQFTLKTSADKAFERHEPIDPVVGYLVQPMDEVVVLSQEFKVKPKPQVYVAPPTMPT
jgi:hypothetical protein